MENARWSSPEGAPDPKVEGASSEPGGSDHNGQSAEAPGHNGLKFLVAAPPPLLGAQASQSQEWGLDATVQALSPDRQAGSAAQRAHHPSHDDGAMNRPLSTQDDRANCSGFYYLGVN